MRPFSLLVFLPERCNPPFREMLYTEAVEIVSCGSTLLACFVCGKEFPARQMYTIPSILKRHLVPLCPEDADRAMKQLDDRCILLDGVVLDALNRHERPFVAKPGTRPSKRTGFSVADMAAAAKLLRIRFSLSPSDN